MAIGGLISNRNFGSFIGSGTVFLLVICVCFFFFSFSSLVKMIIILLILIFICCLLLSAWARTIFYWCERVLWLHFCEFLVLLLDLSKFGINRTVLALAFSLWKLIFLCFCGVEFHFL